MLGSLKFVLEGPIDNKPALVPIGSGNGLTPSRREAITWSNIEHHRRYMVWQSQDELLSGTATYTKYMMIC